MKITTLTKAKYKEVADYAELAWASYGVGFNRGMFGETIDCRGDTGLMKIEDINKLPTYFQVLTQDTSSSFFSQSPSVGFTPNQAKRFISRYRVEDAFYDKDSEMRAVLFFDTQKDRLILGFRGFVFKSGLIENFIQSPNLEKALKAQLSIELFRALFRLSNFLNEKYQNKKISLIGHSFGGYLAQIFCILQPLLIEELYTFDAIGIAPNSRTTKIFLFFSSDIFSSSVSSYGTYRITQEDIGSIELEGNGGGLITFKKENPRLNKFIPYYLKKDEIDSYGMGEKFNKHSMSSFAKKLVCYFHNPLLIGKIIAVDFSITGTMGQNSISNSEILILEDEREEQKLKSLTKQMREANHTLPLPLQQSQIHSFYSSNTRGLSVDIQEELAKFGDHMLATQYEPISINKPFSKESDYSDMKQVLAKGEVKTSLKSIGLSSLISYCLTLTDIQEIYSSLLTLAKCEENTPIATLLKLQEPSIFLSRRV